jgi:DNA-directed RNA polymerase specialized sigma24 family protein
MNRKEIEDLLQKLITRLCHKYRHLNKYIDTEQYIIDAVCGAYFRADYTRSDKELYRFFDKRVRYHLINGLRKATKNKKMIARYLSIMKYLVPGSAEDSLYVETLLDSVTDMTKYDVLPSLIGSVPIRQLAKVNGISTGAMRRWVLKAKEFIRYHLID